MGKVLTEPLGNILTEGMGKVLDVYTGLSPILRDAFDALERPELRRVLSVLAESISTFGLEVALESLEEAVRRQTVDAFSLQALSNRIAYDGLIASPDEGPDLVTYDRALLERS